MKKRNKRAISSILFSLFICLVVIAGVFMLKLKPVGYAYTQKIVEELNSGDSGFSLHFESINKSIFNRLELKGLSLSGPEGEFGYVGEVDISLGLLQFVEIAMGKEPSEVRINVHTVNLNITDSVYDYLSSPGREKSSGTEKAKPGVLERLNINLSVDDINVKTDFRGYRLSAMAAQLSIGLTEGLKPSSFSFRIPNVSGYIPQTEEMLYVTELRADSSAGGSIGFVVDRIYASDSIDIRSIKASADFESIYKIKGSFGFDSVEVHLDEFKADSYDIGSDFEVNLKTKEYSLSINVPSFVFNSEKADSVINDLRAVVSYRGKEDLTVEVFLNQAKLKAFDVNADLFSVSLSGKPQESLSFRIGNFSTQYTPANNSLSGSLDNGKELNADINIGNSIYGTLSYALDNGIFGVDLGISDLHPDLYSNALEKFASFFRGYIVGNTAVYGKISASGVLREDVFNVDSLDSKLRVENAEFGKEPINASAVVSGSYIDKLADFKNLTFETLDKRLSWKGTFDTTTLMPEGQLNIIDLKSFDYIASMDFNYNRESRKYSFNAVAKAFENMNLSGEIDFSDGSYVHAVSLLETQFRNYVLNCEYNKETKEFAAESQSLKMLVSLENKNLLIARGALNDFQWRVSEDVEVSISNDFSAVYDLYDNSHKLAIEDNFVKVSDILNVGFNFTMSDKNLEFSSIQIGRKDSDYSFDGKISVRDFDFSEVFSGNPNAVVNAGLTRRNTDQYVRFNMKGSDVWADIYLKLPVDFHLSFLGSLNGDFFFEGSIGDFFFDSKYSEGKLSINDSSGSFGNVRISGFDLNVDFIKRTLVTDFKVENERKVRDGVERQGAEVVIQAQLDSLNSAALNLAGLDADAEFDIRLSNVFLSDGFTVPDNTFILSTHGSNYSVSGDIINGSYDSKTGEFEFVLDKKSSILGFSAKGNIKEDIDVVVDDIFINVPVVNQFVNTPECTPINGFIEGSILVKGPLKDPSIYGMLYSENLDFKVFYAPEQVISLKNASICVDDHCVTMAGTKIFGSSTYDGRKYTGRLSVDLDMVGLSVGSMDLHLILDDNPADVWVPVLGEPDIMIRADVLGDVHFKTIGGVFGIYGDVKVSDGYVSFVIPKMPDWFYGEVILCTLDLNIDFGKNIEFYYPDVTDSFVNFTIAEGESLHYAYDRTTDIASFEGKMGVKNGTVFYFQNDFYVTGGEARLSKNKFSGDIELSFDLSAKLKDYDSEGNSVEIYLDLNNATFDNLSPRLESSNGLSQNDIVQILGKSIVPSNEQGISVSSLASFAFIATDTISRLGIIESNSSYSLTSAIRDALDLDILSFRSPIVQNMILDVLPGNNAKNVSLLAKYLNGTTLFLGKYINKQVFFKTSVLLKASPFGYGGENVGHFMTNDLNINLEISAEWDTPMGVMTVFTQPTELSVFDFLDNIGFSFSKTIRL